MDEDIDAGEDRRVDRRTLIKGGAAATGALIGAAALIHAADGSSGPPARSTAVEPAPGRPAARDTRPNILVIIVDQLRFPKWFGPSRASVGLPPNIARLRQGAVSFARHYTASNDCSPARATLLTGLYTHQTGCMITGGSTLDPGFPTWGTMLGELGYHTRWFGKWHLTHHDNRWNDTTGEAALRRYGFGGGVFPSPDGAPGQGFHKDPQIVAAFEEWFDADGTGAPWCTTVSLVNPHDIAWWYVWTDRVAAEARPTRTARRLPPNYETPQHMIEQRKPRLQRSLQETAAASFGSVPFTGEQVTTSWLGLLDLYAELQREVDGHVGQVLRKLESNPEVAANTVIIFTSDHGEYGASHGLRGKGAAVYEEGIRVPFIVRDPRGVLTRAPERERTQLTSSVDVAPMLLSIATGSEAWREQEHHRHIARRLNMAAILADPAAPGRPHVLHATDEVVTEFAIEPYSAEAPLHVMAIRTPRAKYATYSHWPQAGITPLAEGREVELYDHASVGGRLETINVAGRSRLEEPMNAALERAVRRELREPLPPYLSAAHGRGLADFFSTARSDAESATAARRRRSERRIGDIAKLKPHPVPPARR